MRFIGSYLLAVMLGSMMFMMTNIGEAAGNDMKLPLVNTQKIAKDKTAQEWFAQGLDYHKRYLYDNAIQAYTKALAIDGQYADAYYNRGHAYAEMYNYDAALADFSKAIDLVPQEAEIYYNRGVVYDSKEFYEQALSDYNQALALNPEYADAYYNKAISLENLGRSEEAKAAYTAFIQYAPANDPDLPLAKERLQLISQE